jgi:hypothetical protein
MQALDPRSGPADTTMRSRTDMVGWQFGVALGGVSGMCIGNEHGVNL